MSAGVKYILIGIFLVVLITTVVLGWQYLSATNNSPFVNVVTKTVSDNLNTIGNPSQVFSSKVVLINNAKNYKVTMPDQNDVEKLAETLSLFNNSDKKFSRIEIKTEDTIQNGTEHSIDSKVWVKINPIVENDSLNISLMLIPDTMKSIQNIDWNSQVSYVILVELYNLSPSYANTPVINRVDLIGKLINQKKEGDSNKYYFETSF